MSLWTSAHQKQTRWCAQVAFRWFLRPLKLWGCCCPTVLCRFYFLGDDDLLEVLGQGASLAIIQPHLKKLFAGIHRVGLMAWMAPLGCLLTGKRLATAAASTFGCFSSNIHTGAPACCHECLPTWCLGVQLLSIQNAYSPAHAGPLLSRPEGHHCNGLLRRRGG